MSSRNWIAIALVFCAATTALQGQTVPTDVPSAFEPLYSSLSGYVTSFAQTVDSNWNGAKHPVAFTAQLSSANANTGPSMLQPRHYQGLLMELDGLQALGVKTILVEVPFPVLYRPYYASDSEYQQYVDFYRQVAQDVKARGLKLIVDSAFLLSRGAATVYANPGPYYKGLSWDQYRAGRASNAKNVLEIMAPEYLIVLQEPDTEARSTGQAQANTVAGSTLMLNEILSALQPARGTTRIGAGFGSWQYGYADFARSFTATSIDFIDMHVFHANGKFLAQAATIADIATNAGKGVAISGAWLTKSRDDEVFLMAMGLLPDIYVVARDAFSFWAPLDSAFLQTFVKFAHWKRLEFIAPFFSQYLRAYLPYNASTQSLHPLQLNLLNLQQQVINMSAGIYSSTGLDYSRTILEAADTVAPTAPGSVSAIGGLTGGVTVWWSASTDNVGVAGYTVFRDGVAIGRTFRPYFQDGAGGLTRATTYRYQVQAFDVAGNVSGPSTSTASAKTR